MQGCDRWWDGAGDGQALDADVHVGDERGQGSQLRTDSGGKLLGDVLGDVIEVGRWLIADGRGGKVDGENYGRFWQNPKMGQTGLVRDKRARGMEGRELHKSS